MRREAVWGGNWRMKEEEWEEEEEEEEKAGGRRAWREGGREGGTKASKSVTTVSDTGHSSPAALAGGTRGKTLP